MNELSLNINQYGFIDFNTSSFKYKGVDVFSLLMEFQFKNQELVKCILEYIIPEKRNIVGNVFYLFICIKEYIAYYMNHYNPNNPISQEFLHGLNKFCEREFFNLYIFDYYLNMSTEFREFLKFKVLSFIKNMNYGKDENIKVIDSYHNIMDSAAFMNTGLQFNFILEKINNGFKTINERLDNVELEFKTFKKETNSRLLALEKNVFDNV